MSPDAAGPPAAGGGEVRDRGLRYEVRVEVDGRALPLKEFLHDLIGGAVTGLLSGLRGAGEASEVRLEIRRR